MKTKHSLSVAALILLGWNTDVFGQAECAAGGNLRGIRVDGELMAFTASIRAVASSRADESQGGRGRGGGGQFSRDEGTLVVTGNLTGGASRGGGPGVGGRGRGGAPVAGANYRAIYKDGALGTVEAEIQITSTTNLPLQGVFFAIALPGADYAGGSAHLLAPVAAAETPVSLAATSPAGTNVYVRAFAKGVRVVAPRRQIEINLPAAAEFVIRDVHTRSGTDLEVSFPLSLGSLTNEQVVRAAFTLKATGEIDKSPARLVVDPSRPGRKYDGMGGNFRIQSPADAAQIQYNLEHLRIAWGRVAMPLDRWQPNENDDPVAAATSGTLNSSVREAMEMAQKLARKNIPTIVSIWFAPGWALAAGGSGRGGRARINPDKWDQVCKSIGSYLEYMKKNYDAEAVLFSFNESDMGINVLQSPQEHAEAIKRLGAYFASRGLKTRMLLGDTGNPTGDRFIDAALADAEAGQYIGAVSFHSWNSGTTEQYRHFSQAARKLDVPLLVAEGGLDPSAHQYRAIFLEPWFCLNEIAQYVEICRVAQPLSILHWQLTADYSILTGGTSGQPLQPAQRFWQIRQLGMTTPGSTAMAITCDNPKVISCAYADHEACVVHMINNGAARTALISGLPGNLKDMRVFVTDARRGMQETGRVPVVQGRVELPVDAMSFTSLTGSP